MKSKQLRKDQILRRLVGAEWHEAEKVLSAVAEHVPGRHDNVAGGYVLKKMGTRTLQRNLPVGVNQSFQEDAIETSVLLSELQRLVNSVEESKSRLERERTLLLSLFEVVAGEFRETLKVEQLRSVLTDEKRAHSPLDWAAMQDQLGQALYSLGTKQHSELRFQEAEHAFREALTEISKERMPRKWAELQHSLGAALFQQGKLDAAKEVLMGIPVDNANESLAVQPKEASTASLVKR